MQEPDIQEFSEVLSSNPDLLAAIKKRAELEDFKAKYHIDRATPLRCPVCNQYGTSGGSLWQHSDNPHLFTCRKCHLTFSLACTDLPVQELISKLRKISKEGTSIFEIAKEKRDGE